MPYLSSYDLVAISGISLKDESSASNRLTVLFSHLLPIYNKLFVRVCLRSLNTYQSLVWTLLWAQVWSATSLCVCVWWARCDVGIDRIENDVICTIMSLAIQYFTMVSVIWIGAEGVFMFNIYQAPILITETIVKYCMASDMIVQVS